MKSVMNEEYTISYKKSVLLGQNMNSALVEYIDGIEVIKAFNQGTSFYKKYSDAVRDNAQFYYDWMGRCMKRISVGRLLSPMGILTVIPFGMIFYKNGSIEAETLISIVVLTFVTVSNLLKTLNYTDDLARISTISGEVEKVLGSKSLKHGVSTQKINHYDIEYKDVNFSYDEEKKVINNLYLKFEEGKVNALVRKSGSGKSTIAKLLAGFWNVENGCIKIGGIDINEIPLSQLSQLISYVSQDNFLFDLSIKDNIRIANPEATNIEVEQIAIKAGCDGFIKDFPNGYDTIVGEGGGHLSGGEKQRISIARAMLKDSPIVILDEATSYIDPENEVVIQRAISKLVKGKTLIIIAHRLNTIKDVNKIFVINEGRVESSGTHEELLMNSEKYTSNSVASITRIIKAINELNPETILFTGGEVSLEWDMLISILDILRGKGFKYILSSNLTILSKEKLSKLIDEYEFDRFHSSFNDLTLEMSKSVRKATSINRATLIDNIKYLCDRDMDLRIETIITEKTVTHLSDINHFLCKLGVKKHKLEFLIPLGQAVDLSTIDYHVAFDAALKVYEGKDKNMKLILCCCPCTPCMLEHDIFKIKADDFEFNHCIDGTSSCYLLANGRLLPCFIFPDNLIKKESESYADQWLNGYMVKNLLE